MQVVRYEYGDMAGAWIELLADNVLTRESEGKEGERSAN